MTPVRIALLAAAAALAGAAGAAVHHPAPAHATNWTHVVGPTADGGVRVGNPQAKVKLVEYFSTTCPHCAAFSKEAYPQILDKYVRGGAVSFEVRAALRDAIDATVATSARCAAPPRYFATLEDVMAAQSDWEPKAIDWVNAHQADLKTADKAAQNAQVEKMLTDVGIAAIVARHGVTATALGGCLANPAMKKALETGADEAWNVRKIDGTPAFYINDAVLANVYVWSQLEPLIRKALDA